MIYSLYFATHDLLKHGTNIFHFTCIYSIYSYLFVEPEQSIFLEDLTHKVENVYHPKEKLGWI